MKIAWTMANYPVLEVQYALSTNVRDNVKLTWMNKMKRLSD